MLRSQSQEGSEERCWCDVRKKEEENLIFFHWLTREVRGGRGEWFKDFWEINIYIGIVRRDFILYLPPLTLLDTFLFSSLRHSTRLDSTDKYFVKEIAIIFMKRREKKFLSSCSDMKISVTHFWDDFEFAYKSRFYSNFQFV